MIPKRRKKILRSAGFFVYVLRCSDQTLYTGYTKDLTSRLKLHNAGKGAKYVRGRTPVKVVYFKTYRFYKHAIKEECRIKALTRLEKEKLIKKRPAYKGKGIQG